MLTPAPGYQAGSVSRLFLLPLVPAATEEARTWPPSHPPSNRVGPLGISVDTASGIPVASFGATWPSSGPLRLPRRPPDHHPFTSVGPSGLAASGISVASFGAARPSLALRRPPKRPPDHEPCTSGVGPHFGSVCAPIIGPRGCPHPSWRRCLCCSHHQLPCQSHFS